MTGLGSLNLDQLKTHAPNSSILAFRPVDSGSPMQDWCSHLQQYSIRRRELEEFSILGNVVVRIADGIEPEPIEKVKILSLEYAVRVLKSEEDAKEFIRCVKAIASPEADQFELEQLASYYYKEIRLRGSIPEVLKEMGLLGLKMQAVTTTINEREIDFLELEVPEQKLSVADQRNLKKIQKTRSPLPDQTPNFNAEMKCIRKKISNKKTSNFRSDDYADFYLSDGDKSIEELDRDFRTFEKLEQYDENGILGFSMNSGQRSVVVFDFETEVDIDLLPEDVKPLAREMNLLFVGHKIGGSAARKARKFVYASRIEQMETDALKNGFLSAEQNIPSAEEFSELPFSNKEFSDWLAVKLDSLYPDRTKRTKRRLITNKAGVTFDVPTKIEINPDWAEMNYVLNVCRTLWKSKQKDFHLKSLRRKKYQNYYLELRKSVDTAEVARLKRESFNAFKQQKRLSLKEFTALNTVAKSQEARLQNKISHQTRKLLAEIREASYKRVRYFKYFLYNNNEIKHLPRQEKQFLWDAVKSRETQVKQSVKPIQPSLFVNKQQKEKLVRVTPQAV